MTRSRDVSAVQNNLGVAIPPAAAGKNVVINGGMDIWQRGTSITTSGAYTADRWNQVSGVSATFSRSTDVPSNQGFTYSMSMAGVGPNINQRVESINAAPLAGQTVTLSFWYKSTVGSDVLNVQLWYANTADNFAGLTQIGSTQTISTPATSWTRVSYTFTNISANAINGLSFYIYRGNTATSTTLVTGVQLELGSSATPFSRNGSSIQGELAACQRYYWRQTATGASNVISVSNSAYANNGIVAVWPNPVPMRVKASSVDSSSVEVTDWVTATASNSITVDANSTTNFSVAIVGVAGTPLTQYRPYTLRASTSTGYIGFSAEL